MNAFPKPVIDAMADRAMRLHHMLWHLTRDSWAVLTPAGKEVFTDHGWVPPRPSRGPKDPATGNRPVELDNGSGEDFLYMHRVMIAEVNHILAEVGDPQHPQVQGWVTIPAPDDPDFPVPPAYQLPGDPGGTQSLLNVKSQAAYDQIHARETQVTDPAVLRQITLGHLGAFVEFFIHNTLHMRWSSQMPEYRPGGDAFSVDPRWDDSAYNWLGDTYSSHVNPLFWKIHGWVDARIDDWMAANNLQGPVPWSFDPPWSGPEGGHGHDHGHGHHPVAHLALRARPGSPEAEALHSRLRAMEATVEDLKRVGVTEPARFPLHDGDL
ncbi:hypothetical protein [Streptomyces griseorubiginosus]|uniref:hypothetical protein n=1 Tax=Streptomyces griseorubiginosus TaxID=67304 RepID=UPI003405C66B